MAPQTQKQWTVQGTGSFDNLKFNEKASVPEIGDRDVLVKCRHKLERLEYLQANEPFCSPRRVAQLP